MDSTPNPEAAGFDGARLYSMSKPITGVALLSLAERAKVKLSDPIHRFLPEWRDVRVSVMATVRSSLAVVGPE